MRRVALVGICLASTLASADEVLLQGGGKVTGVIVERTASTIVVEVGPGLVTLPLSRVLRVQEGASALATYRDRAFRLAAGDLAGWLALGRWARQQDLVTQSREAFARVLSIDPGNGEANEALGRVLVGERWVSAEEGYRARGLVPFDGGWVTPAEQEALLREQAEAAAASTSRAEAEARAREAEARAREAEARAAEAEARQAGAGYGMGIGYGGVGIPYLPYGGWVTVSRCPFGHRPVRARLARASMVPAVPPTLSDRHLRTHPVLPASPPPRAKPLRPMP